MNTSKIEELLLRLESSHTSTVTHDLVLKALRTESNLDWGDDPATWREWWMAVRNDSHDDARGPTMTPAQQQAQATLREMGVIDEDEFLRAVEQSLRLQFTDMAGDLILYLRNNSGPSIWLSNDCDSYCQTLYECEKTAKQIQRMLRTEMVVSVQKIKGGFELLVNGGTTTITSAPRQTIFQFIHEWLCRNAQSESVWLDDEGRAWVLSPANLAAIKRQRALRFRHLNRTTVGIPHSDIERAIADLAAIGVELSIASLRLAWEISEYYPDSDDLEYSYHTQAIHLDNPGVETFACESLNTRSITAKLSTMVQQKLIPPTLEFEASTPQEVQAFVDALNRQLQSSPLRIIAMGVQRQWLRFMPIPVDRIEPLSRFTNLVWGNVPTKSAISTSAFRFGKVPQLKDIVPDDRLLVFDAECIDEASDYEELVRDMLALARGNIAVDAIDCADSEDQETRRLNVTMKSKAFTAELAVNADWADISSLLICLNRIAAHVGFNHRYCEVRELEWDQECGVALASTAEYEALMLGGFVVSEESDEAPDENLDEDE